MAQQQTQTLPKDTNAALLEMTHIIKKLGGIYEDETSALNNIDNEQFLSLQENKLVIAQEYRENMVQILDRKNEVSKTSPAMKRKLQEIYEEFQEISRKNMESLERMQKCTESLGNKLRSAAIRDAHKQNGYSYGNNGSISNTSSKKPVSSGLSETV